VQSSPLFHLAESFPVWHTSSIQAITYYNHANRVVVVVVVVAAGAAVLAMADIIVLKGVGRALVGRLVLYPSLTLSLSLDKPALISD